MARRTSWLKVAYDYHRFGFTPIPLQGGKEAKHPLIWSSSLECGFKKGELKKLYRTGWGASPFTWERFDEMFSLAGGIGIACGKRSGGLAVVDFDDLAAHEIWLRKYAELARTLPCVRTSRGVHYYFVLADSPSGDGFDFFVEGYSEQAGELKLGGYVVAPPSRHVSGVKYRWRDKHSWERGLPVVDLQQLGVRRAAGSATDTADLTADQRELQIQTLTGSLTHLGGNAESSLGFNCWKQALCLMRRHLPRRAKCRNKSLLALVRSLYAVRELRNHPAKHFELLIRVWCEELAKLPFVRTPGFRENWIEFATAWKHCTKSSADGFRDILKGLKLDGLNTRNKARAICQRLCQHVQGEAFALGSITLASVLGVSQKQAMRILKRLTSDHELILVSMGRRSDWTANRYQLGPRFRVERPDLVREPP